MNGGNFLSNYTSVCKYGPILSSCRIHRMSVKLTFNTCLVRSVIHRCQLSS